MSQKRALHEDVDEGQSFLAMEDGRKHSWAFATYVFGRVKCRIGIILVHIVHIVP